MISLLIILAGWSLAYALPLSIKRLLLELLNWSPPWWMSVG